MTEENSLAGRIARLERQNRRMRATLAAVCALAAVALVYRATPLASQETEVRATKFILLDKDGNGRAGLLVGSNNEPSLVLINRNGKSSANLGITENNAYLSLTGPGSPFEVNLVSAKDAAEISFQRGNASSMILQQKADQSVFMLWGQPGSNRFQLAVNGAKSELLMVGAKGTDLWHAEIAKAP